MRYRFRPRRSPEERFAEKVLTATGDDCWLWQGTRDRDGYGLFKVSEDKCIGAHRYAFLLAYGEILAGCMICHRCDNPGCVRADHLFVGTASDNNADRDRKGRAAKGERHPNWGKFKPLQYQLKLQRFMALRGAANGRAKLSEAQVRAIRIDNRSAPRVAAELGVTATLVNMIRRREVWKHVQ